MGYKLAGCEVVAANDLDPEMAYHYKLNIEPKHYFLCPIRDLLRQDLPRELFGIDILDGSPPCSTFSMAGSREKDWGKKKHFREGQTSQVLSDLFFDYLDLVGHLKPKVAIAENVKGMIMGNARGYTKLVMARFKELGYRPQLFLLNAANCGVPQRRERVFFCALRNDIVAPVLKISCQTKLISVGEATKDLQTLTKKEKADTEFTSCTYKTWWPMTNPGEDFGAATRRLGPEKLWNHKKLCKTKPSNTLVAVHGNITHWAEPRHLTYREWKRLGSFPDDYQARTDAIGKYMVGMSVPPKMAEVVARAVVDQWLLPKETKP